jgi:hypothetical protein
MREITQDEYVDALERANKWKIRAKVAYEIANYLNEIYMPDGPFIDLKKEIKIQSELMMKNRVG